MQAIFDIRQHSISFDFFRFSSYVGLVLTCMDTELNRTPTNPKRDMEKSRPRCGVDVSMVSQFAIHCQKTTLRTAPLPPQRETL